MVSLDVDEEKCVGCGECEFVCPRNVFDLEKVSNDDSKKVAVVSNEEACIMCMACIAVCERDCIKISDPSSEMIL